MSLTSAKMPSLKDKITEEEENNTKVELADTPTKARASKEKKKK